MSAPISYKAGVGSARGKVGKVAKAVAVVPVKVKSTAEQKNPKDAKELFLKRIQMCSVTYDYSDDAKDAKAKTERLTALQELREFLNDSKTNSLIIHNSKVFPKHFNIAFLNNS